ncbi:hypothetical protein [Streptomyces sp. NPDC000410]|uniref:terpene synthase family protein n=1 Tax=Streptomyces sp. NPDC000410 TaxID=3154254 RepID=UPI00332623B6
MDATPAHGRLLETIGRYFPALDLSVDRGLAEELGTRMVDFAHRHRLADRETLAHLGKTACNSIYFIAAYPDASKENQQLICDIFMWFAAFDDIHAERIDSTAADSVARHTFALLEALDGTLTESAPGFETALADILRRAQAWDPRQQGNLRNALHGVLLGWQWEAQLRNTGGQPSLQTYLYARRHSIAAVLERAIAEPMSGHVLPDVQRNDPELVRLNRAFSNLSGWVNDLFSYEGEKRRDGQLSVNLPNVLMREQGCSLSDAIARISEMIVGEAEVAARSLQSLSASPSPEVRAYVRGTERVLRLHTALFVVSGFGRYIEG